MWLFKAKPPTLEEQIEIQRQADIQDRIDVLLKALGVPETPYGVSHDEIITVLGERLLKLERREQIGGH